MADIKKPEFEVFDPMDCFTPVWNETLIRWDFDHTNGKRYRNVSILMMFSCTNAKMASLYDTYLENAYLSSFNKMFPDFMMHWLRVMHQLNAINYAEAARIAFMDANPKKGKQSEGVYNAAYDEFSNKYKELK